MRTDCNWCGREYRYGSGGTGNLSCCSTKCWNEKLESERKKSKKLSKEAGNAASVAGGGLAIIAIIGIAAIINAEDKPLVSGVCWKLSKKYNTNLKTLRFLVFFTSFFTAFAVPIVYFILANMWRNKIKMMQSDSGER